MKTKINKICMIFLASVTLLFGCSKDFLDTQQLGVTDVNSYYKTDADATGAIMAAYNMIKAMNGSSWTSQWMCKMSLSDEILTGGSDAGDRPEYQELTKFTFGADNPVITNIYRYAYFVINRANIVVDKFGALPAPTNYMKQVIAEAKVLRAYMYFELVTLYGTPPLVLHDLLPADYATPNSSAASLWAQIELDCQAGIDGLPAKKDQVAAGFDVARASKGFAQALLGKSLLYEKKYAAAAAVLKTLIDSGDYELYTMDDLGYPTDSLAYSQLFRKSTEFGKESIFEVSYANGRANDWSNAFGDVWNDPSRTDPSNNVWQLCGPRGDQGFNGGSFGIGGGWGFGYPTYSLHQAYKDLGDSIRMHANIINLQQLKQHNGTLIATAYDKTSDTYTETNFPWGCPGFIRAKYTTWNDETTPPVAELNYGTNLRIIRYSDVLLMAAEAYLGAGDATSATPYFNQVRTRVLLPAVGLVSLDDIKLERRLELSFEGNRYQDLVRWGDAQTVLATQGQTIPKGILTGTHLPSVLIPDKDGVNHKWVFYDLTQPLTNEFTPVNNGAGFKAKNVLFPIPQNEMNSNPNMKQNDGYQ